MLLIYQCLIYQRKFLKQKSISRWKLLMKFLVVYILSVNRTSSRMWTSFVLVLKFIQIYRPNFFTLEQIKLWSSLMNKISLKNRFIVIRGSVSNQLMNNQLSIKLKLFLTLSSLFGKLHVLYWKVWQQMSKVNY